MFQSSYDREWFETLNSYQNGLEWIRLKKR